MSSKTFITEQLAVCPYLQMNGLKYLRAELSIGKNDKPVVCFVFEDPLGVGKDLELDFTKSEFKKYRDMTFFFRNEIEKMRKQLERVRLEDSRKEDDKYVDTIYKRGT
jgi:hypothetical protein